MKNTDLNKKCRKMQLTINNPQKPVTTTINKGLNTVEDTKNYIDGTRLIKDGDYYCFSFERGLKEATPHIHIFFCFKSPRTGNSIKKYFPTCHIEFCSGSIDENVDYIAKTGKWKESEKEKTKIDGMFFENKERPKEAGRGKRNDLEQLRELIKNGADNVTIYDTNANYLLYSSTIDRIRQEYLQTECRKKFRQLEVTYVFGKTGTGKTRGIMERYGYENVKRITNYDHPFDDYKGEDVIIFEEFRNSLAIEQMLNYLDGYPVCLPCRYSDKWACFTKVFICTNWTLEEQYQNIQENYPETWNAFLRRIHNVKEYTEGGVLECTVKQYYDNKELSWEDMAAEVPTLEEEFEIYKQQNNPFGVTSEEELFNNFWNEKLKRAKAAA